MNYEEYAISKHPKSGKCEKSCFANGWHRVGTVPVFSVLDNGIAGCVTKEICLECGKFFDKARMFMLRDQPSRLKQ